MYYRFVYKLCILIIFNENQTTIITWITQLLQSIKLYPLNTWSSRTPGYLFLVHEAETTRLAVAQGMGISTVFWPTTMPHYADKHGESDYLGQVHVQLLHDTSCHPSKIHLHDRSCPLSKIHVHFTFQQSPWTIHIPVTCYTQQKGHWYRDLMVSLLLTWINCRATIKRVPLSLMWSQCHPNVISTDRSPNLSNKFVADDKQNVTIVEHWSHSGSTLLRYLLFPNNTFELIV